MKIDKIELLKGEKIAFWTCHWCGKQRAGGREWHHETFGRNCCRRCYNDEDSNFQKIYGPEADQEKEIASVKAGREPPPRQSSPRPGRA